MVDPIESLSDQECAYIAGLIDGDGCIRIAAVGTNRRYFYPVVSVAMTHRGVIEWLSGKLSSGTIKTFNYTQLKKNPNWRRQYGAVVHGKRAQLLCRRLLPWLRVKREHALLVLDFPCDDRRGHKYGHRVSDEVLGERERLRESMLVLNRRGPVKEE